ncbi:hypothetical protein ACJMK2_012316 [Sinanodonta woodiana]|uniref:Uncharacterized protein n=1 Tax=Sinanodonta woodiana TaxID=1069815 RepID=A0ABD3V7V5_SINWO
MPEYHNRLVLDDSNGISLYNVTTADTGDYALFVTPQWSVNDDPQTHQLIIVSDANPIYSCAVIPSFAADNNHSIPISVYTVINSSRCCTNSSNCVSTVSVHNYTQHDNGFCETTLLVDFTPTKLTTANQPRLDTNTPQPQPRQRDNVESLNQLDTILSQLNAIQTRLNTIATQQRGSDEDATAAQQPQSRQSDFIVVIIITAISSTGIIVLLIVALLFIIRGNRAVLSRLEKPVSKETIELISHDDG